MNAAMSEISWKQLNGEYNSSLFEKQLMVKHT